MDPRRREFIRRAVAASILVGVGGVAIWDLIQVEESPGPGASVTLLQTSTQQASTTGGTSSQTSTQSVPAGYFFVAQLSALSGKNSAYFTHPTQGLSMLVSVGGQWKAFSATCTHAPCTVEYSGTQIKCPCHGGTFNTTNGSVVSGPPPTRLPEFGVVVQSGNLYVSDGIVN
ncbi:MAG TPA: Rieske 2Fe-2S domain-containing protein [Nitrososphaerales archaeon]|nr:Rieske 2Fe-2S domain-containing protein [Nitrososphaerales archaeon]